MWITGTNPVHGGNGIFVWTGSSWAGGPGGATSIAVGSDGSPWVVNALGQIFQLTGAGWALYPGSATDIGVAANGVVWVIGTNPAPGGFGIFQWTGARWTAASGGGSRIAVDPNGSPWVTNSMRQIYSS